MGKKTDILEVLQKGRNQTNAIINGIKDLSIEQVKSALSLTDKEIYGEDSTPNSKEEDIRINKLKTYLYALSEFINTKDFDKTKNLDYFNITSQICNPVVYPFLCWTLNKKDECKEILSLNDFSLKEKDYQDLVDVTNPYNSRNDYYLIFETAEREKLKNDEMKEFLFLQKNFRINSDLKKDLKNRKNTKKNKI